MSANAQAVKWKGDSFLDYNGSLGWNSDLGLGLEVGYRYFRLKPDELRDSKKADLVIDGPFAALNYRF